jgi:hypothetical protein
VNRRPVRAGVDQRADGLVRSDRLPLSDQGMGHDAAHPDTKVDDGSVRTDRDAEERHQVRALGMW